MSGTALVPLSTQPLDPKLSARIAALRAAQLERAARWRNRPGKISPGKTWAAVACATFAGGEKIRMSYAQPANKPWQFEAMRRWLCQIIGNERGHLSPAHAAELRDLKRKVGAAQALAIKGATKGERAAARRTVEKLAATAAKKYNAALGDVFDAMNVYSRVYPPATDLVDFWIESGGEEHRAELLPAPKARPARAKAAGDAGTARARVNSPASVPRTPEPPPEPNVIDLVKMLEERLGDFAKTRSWGRVQTRAKKLAA